jgi:hypothetical protein
MWHKESRVGSEARNQQSREDSLPHLFKSLLAGIALLAMLIVNGSGPLSAEATGERQ